MVMAQLCKHKGPRNLAVKNFGTPSRIFLRFGAAGCCGLANTKVLEGGFKSYQRVVNKGCNKRGLLGLV